MATKPEKKKTVETLTHEEASRKNIPTAEFQSVMHKKEQSPVRVAYERRNRDDTGAVVGQCEFVIRAPGDEVWDRYVGLT